MRSEKFEVQVAHSVEEVGPEAWGQLGKGQPFASYRWYHFGETVLTGDTPIYIVLSRGGETVARATFWVTSKEPVPIASKAIRYIIQTMLRHRPLMACRSPLANCSGLILPEPPLRDVALRIIAQVAQDEALRHRASFAIFDYLSSHETQWAGWPNAFAQTEFPNPGTRLVIAWPDFESYFKHLRKSMRKDYRRHHNRAADLEIEVRRHPTVTNLDEAMLLIRNVEKHHNSAPNPWARKMLENANMVDTAWLTAEIADRMAGCGLLLGDRGAWLLTLLGLDYTVRYAYFQLVYAAIRCAIETGAQILRGGGGAYRMKERLGFQLENDNYVYFTTNNPGLRWLGQRLALS